MKKPRIDDVGPGLFDARADYGEVTGAVVDRSVEVDVVSVDIVVVSVVTGAVVWTGEVVSSAGLVVLPGVQAAATRRAATRARRRIMVHLLGLGGLAPAVSWTFARVPARRVDHGHRNRPTIATEAQAEAAAVADACHAGQAGRPAPAPPQNLQSRCHTRSAGVQHRGDGRAPTICAAGSQPGRQLRENHP